MAEQDGKPRQGGRGCRFDAAGGVIVDIAAADRQQGDQVSSVVQAIRMKMPPMPQYQAIAPAISAVKKFPRG